MISTNKEGQLKMLNLQRENIVSDIMDLENENELYEEDDSTYNDSEIASLKEDLEAIDLEIQSLEGEMNEE